MTFEQLMKRISNRVVEVGDCLEWIGAYSHKSPLVRVGEHSRSLRRVMWEAKNGPLSKDRYVHINCGNWRCVSPDHLACKSKEAHYKSAAKYRSHLSYVQGGIKSKIDSRKLTPDQVMDIIMSDETQRALARKYEVTIKTIWRIKRGEIYKDVVGMGMWGQLLRKAA